MVGDLYKKLRTKYLWLSIIIIGIVFTVGIFSFYEFHQRHRRKPLTPSNNNSSTSRIPNNYTCNENTLLISSLRSIRILFFLLLLVKGSNSATMDAPISYFTNPSYPETDWVPNYNTYTIKVRNTYIPNTFIMFSYSIQQYYASLNTTT